MKLANESNVWFSGSGSSNIPSTEKREKNTENEDFFFSLDVIKQKNEMNEEWVQNSEEKKIEKPLMSQQNYLFDDIKLDESGFCFDIYKSLSEYENKNNISGETLFLDNIGDSVSIDFVSNEKNTIKNIDGLLDKEELETKEKILKRLEKNTETRNMFGKEEITMSQIENENFFFFSGEMQKKGELYLHPGRQGRKTNKPPLSYATLIIQAIRSSPKGKMTLKQIYDWMKSSFPQYNFSGSAWQNSIRHNLSLNRCFAKVPRTSEEHGKGGFWCINKDFLAKQEALKECGMKPEPCTNRKAVSKRKQIKNIRYKNTEDCNKTKESHSKQKKKESYFFQQNTEGINRELDAAICEQFLYSEIPHGKEDQKFSFIPYKK